MNIWVIVRRIWRSQKKKFALFYIFTTWNGKMRHKQPTKFVMEMVGADQHVSIRDIARELKIDQSTYIICKRLHLKRSSIFDYLTKQTKII